ncbi:MAG: molecular chaperone Tir [Candidatus Spechtbacteria bacterium SB0662_bin_43]|uniref:Molecular chaperone Tir n=1 Tax=Candidatus Spechtbacteria bacterium SB0662_bin_43 TaxID=2604897 RepID=A0A845D8S8_9BACT|nr:molecular chaperone Tir [Candidatus Spechtbacteria bacterium SB0662_bin_43]
MRTYNIFISHSWNYSNQYQRLTELLKQAPYFQHKDYSIPKDDPVHNASLDRELEEAIENKMNFCSVIIVLAGVYADPSYSKWIAKEVRIAQKQSKPILAIEYWGSERTSQFVKENADKIVRWNGSSIVSAIKELYDK